MQKIQYLLFILLVVTSLAPTQAMGQKVQNKQVLLLHSYHTGYKWTDDITAAIVKKLQSKHKVNLYVEYMDTKRYVSKEHEAILFELLRSKYSDHSFDVIICSDNNAFHFLMAHKDTLFPRVPVIFCGVNNFHKDLIRGRGAVTGVSEDIEIEKNIELILKLHPDTKRIAVINDQTTTGNAINASIRAIKNRFPNVVLEFPEGLTIKQLQYYLSNLHKNDVVLLGVFFRDSAGNSFDPEETARIISSQTTVPIYGLWDFYLGYGIVGGLLASGTSQGESAGAMSWDLINGKMIMDIPVMMESPNWYMFDHAMLQRFDISSSNLPPGSVVINRPESLFTKHKGLFLLIGLLFLLLILVVGVLAIIQWKKRFVEKGLIKIQDELEEQVNKRTDELATAHANLQQSKQQMDVLLSNLPGMAYRCIQDGDEWKNLFVSDGCKKLTGYHSEDFINSSVLSFSSLILKEDRERVNNTVHSSLKAKRPYNLEYRIKDKAGGVKWVWEQGRGIYNDQGDLQHLEGFIENITDRKVSETRLSRLAAAIRQIDDGVVITDAKGAITFVNPAFSRITGYSYDQAVGQNPRILKSGKQDKKVYEDLWETLLRGDVWRGIFINKKKDGSEYNAQVTISPVRNDLGEIENYVGVQRDISQEMLMESQLRQAQKLEAMGTLAGGIAHEINTPAQFVSDNLNFIEESFEDLMAVIKTCISLCETNKKHGLSEAEMNTLDEVMQEKDVAFLEDELPKSLEQSRDGIRHISKIVKSMKQFAHPGEQGKVFSDINDAVENTVTVTSNEWKYVTDLDLQLDPDLPRVMCNVSEINQVMLNIIVNASHAMEDFQKENNAGKGTMTIATRAEKSFVEISIKDEGGGIPAKMQDNVFDPFFTTKEPGRGTGQGLSIAHKIIVENHKGELFFEVDEGKGTTFFIRLPLDVSEKTP